MLSFSFENLDLTERRSDLLLKLSKFSFYLGVTRRIGLEDFLPFLNSLRSVESRFTNIVETTGQGTLAVCPVSFDGDSIEAVRPSVLSSCIEILANDSPTKDL